MNPGQPQPVPDPTPTNGWTNGMALASLRPQFVEHRPVGAQRPPTQYVISYTVLGEQVLGWSEPWLAGMFSLMEILAYLAPGAELDTIRTWMILAVPEPEAMGEEVSRIARPGTRYGRSIQSVVRWCDPVLVSKKIRRQLANRQRALPAYNPG